MSVTFDKESWRERNGEGQEEIRGGKVMHSFDDVMMIKTQKSEIIIYLFYDGPIDMEI